MAKKTLLDAVTPEIVDRAEARVRSSGAIAAKKVSDVPLSRAAEAQLTEALGRRGLEHTGKHVRVPLGEQLAGVLSREGTIAIAALRRALLGATGAAELKSVVEHAVRARAAQLVVRDGKEHLAAPSAATLAPRELDALLDAAAKIAKLRRKLAKPAFGVRPTLLAGDVRHLFPAPAPPLPFAIVDALRSTRAEPFAFLPDLARRTGADAASFCEAITTLAREGRIELRPESGLGTLAPADAAFCPRAPDGTVLSYARPTETG